MNYYARKTWRKVPHGSQETIQAARRNPRRKYHSAPPRHDGVAKLSRTSQLAAWAKRALRRKKADGEMDTRQVDGDAGASRRRLRQGADLDCSVQRPPSRKNRAVPRQLAKGRPADGTKRFERCGIKKRDASPAQCSDREHDRHRPHLTRRSHEAMAQTPSAAAR